MGTRDATAYQGRVAATGEGASASASQVGKGLTFRIGFPCAIMTEYPGAKNSTDKST